VSTQIRQLESELPVGPEEGLSQDSVAQCDELHTVERSSLDLRPIGRIPKARFDQLNEAIRFALDVRCPPG